DRLIAKQSAKEKEATEREAYKPSDIITYKMEETA
ncbi:MAG: site-specific integrase, partial [Phocaeicola sp.]